MIKIKFLSVLLCFISVKLFATTKTWSPTAFKNYWDNDTSWAPFGKPQLGDDVIIPTGNTVDASGFYCFMATCVLQGNAVLNLQENFQVIDSVLISPLATLNWTGGEFNGGGTMRNKGTINILNNAWFCVVQGNNKINNEGTINFPMVNSTTNTSNFALLNGTINNLATGIMDIKGDGNTLYVSTGSLHQVNNWGTIKKTAGTGNNDFAINLHNYPSGKIEVNSGSIQLVNYTDTLEGGVYNIATGSQFIVSAQTYFYNSLTGVLNGAFVLKNHIRVPTTASFDFTGPSHVVWNSGELSNGGVLTNNSKMMVDPTGGGARYNGLTTLINNNDITIKNNTIYMGNGFFTNNASGVVKIKDGGGFYRYLGGNHALKNYGLIQKNDGAGIAEIDLDSITNLGTIECNSGTIRINSWAPKHFKNTIGGIIKGNAAFEFPGNQYQNQGITSPGGISTDTLWINNNSHYNTTGSSVLDIQINGNAQGVTNDYLNITNGNATFAGKVKVTLGYAPAITDTFIVAKCSGSINSCTIDSIALDTFDNVVYTFKVMCIYNNALQLSVKSISNPLEINVLNSLNHALIYPNPAKDILYLELPKTLPHVNVSIYDIMGNVINDFNFTDISNQSIDISKYSNGIYFIKLKIDASQKVYKFVKE